MKNRVLGALSAAAAAAFLCLSARADVVEEPLVNPADETDIWGQKITGLGAGGDETALVFTKTGATMSWMLPDGVKSIRYLVVGGGGAGGACAASSYTSGGGGGAGAALAGSTVVDGGELMTITVGVGGTGCTRSGNNLVAPRMANGNGGTSSLNIGDLQPIIALGGGFGGCNGNSGSNADKIVGSGGCGGGGCGNRDAGTGSTGGNSGGASVKLATNVYPGGGGGGAGLPGGNCYYDDSSRKRGGVGGDGIESDITGEPLWYAGGGGAGAGQSSVAGGAGGKGGGGTGGSNGSPLGASATYYGGGGGGTYNNFTEGKMSSSGYQGIVVVRYSTAKQKNPVVLPEVKGVTYNGELQRADATSFELDKYDVVNEGGTDAGMYPVTLSLKNPDEYEWIDDHSSTDKTLYFVINKANNSWASQPSLSKTSWELDAEPATVNAGAATEGEVIVTYDEGEDVMPLTIGTHKAVFTVEESQNYLGLSKPISYTIDKNTNVWTVEPSMTKTTWVFDEEPGEIVAGAAKYGEIVITYDKDPAIEELPTELGSHKVEFAVAAGETFKELSKTVEYTVTKKINSWTTPPVVTSFNIEDPVPTFVPPEAAHGTVTTYYDNNPSITELPTTLGAHTVTYSVAEDDDYDKFAKTYAFQVTYKPIVDQTDPSKVFGYRIPKLGANHDEVALVFTNTGYTADNPMSYALPQAVTTIDYLVVGGGASGGVTSDANSGGGGGAGGVVTNEMPYEVSAGATLEVAVGKGGVKRTNKQYGQDGANSTLTIGESVFTALKGGAGGTGSSTHNGAGGTGYACGGGAGSAAGASGIGYGGVGTQGGNGADRPSGYWTGGGGGGAGGSAVENSRVGGAGVEVTIFGGNSLMIASGGYGSEAKTTRPNSGSTWGCGGDGACGDTYTTSGAGYQGVVVVRYVEPKGVVMVPYIAPKTYTGEALVADVPANVGYTVTENAGGTDVGEYAVVLTLNEGYHWDGGSTAPEYLVFAIIPAQNEWTVEPSITKATWLTTDEPGVLTPGETKFGSPTATITKDGGDAESFDGTLPTAAGRYVVGYTVETSDNWIDPEVTEKSVAFEIVSGDVVPPFTVTKGEMATIVGDGKVDLSVGYAVHCEVESDKKVDVYAYYAEDGADTTNEVKIAEGVALDAVGTGVIADLKPGVTYWVALGGKGGDTVAPMTEFTAVTMTGPATGLAASATFTNDPKEFVITGSVVPGLGTTTVYLRWSLNSSALDNLATYTFAYGDAGAFTNRVQYVNPTDALTWDVAVSNSFTSTTHGEQKWDAALPASTKKRTDTVSTVYSWTGAGEDNNWANPANWTANRAESFGYPDNVNYAIAQISKTATINLGGGTYSLVKGGSIWLNANSGDVVTFTNGTIKMAIGSSDVELGAAGTTLVFRDATFDRKRMNPVEGATVVVEGASTFTGMIRPKAKAVKIIFRNSENITIGDIFNSNSPDGITGVTVSNALVTVENATVPSTTWTPATFPVTLQNGPDRQARLIFRNTQYDNYNKWDFVQSPYTLTIPEQPYATPYLQTAKPAETTSAKPTFNIDVTNWKRGKRVPILTFTQSANGAATQYGGATLRAYENGVNVTTERNARLEWDATKRTLYYKQDGQFGMMIYVK